MVSFDSLHNFLTFTSKELISLSMPSLFVSNLCKLSIFDLCLEIISKFLSIDTKLPQGYFFHYQLFVSLIC